jgi:hypothetical protein
MGLPIQVAPDLISSIGSFGPAGRGLPNTGALLALLPKQILRTVT